MSSDRLSGRWAESFNSLNLKGDHRRTLNNPSHNQRELLVVLNQSPSAFFGHLDRVKASADGIVQVWPDVAGRRLEYAGERKAASKRKQMKQTAMNLIPNVQFEHVAP